MMSLEAFTDKCIEYIKADQPFIAYRHDNGVGFLKKGLVGHYRDTLGRERELRATAKEIEHFRRCIKKMERDWRTWSTLCVVEYDGIICSKGHPDVLEIVAARFREALP